MFILRNISHSLTYLLPGHEELENKSNGHSIFVFVHLYVIFCHYCYLTSMDVRYLCDT